MKSTTATRVILLICVFLTSAQDIKDSQPQLFLQQSSYVGFKESGVNTSNGTVTFEGRFIVLGEGIYGHFDMVAYNDSGEIVQKVMSGDRPWRRDNGAKLKTVSMSMNAENVLRVEVSFHEMRVNHDSGACKL